MDLNFWGHLASNVGRGVAAWKAGKAVASDREEKERLLDEDRQAKRQQEAEAAKVRATQQREAQLRIEKLEHEEGDRDAHVGHVHGDGGPGTPYIEFGPDSPDSRQKLFDYNAKLGESKRAPPEPRQAPIGPDPFARRRSELNYWTEKAHALVEAHGRGALNVAMDANRNPEFREAIRSGKVPKEIFTQELNATRRGQRATPKPPVDPEEEAASTAYRAEASTKVDEEYGAPSTPLQRDIYRDLLKGIPPARILQMIQEGQPPEAVRAAREYLKLK